MLTLVLFSPFQCRQPVLCEPALPLHPRVEKQSHLPLDWCAPASARLHSFSSFWIHSTDPHHFLHSLLIRTSPGSIDGSGGESSLSGPFMSRSTPSGTSRWATSGQSGPTVFSTSFGSKPASLLVSFLLTVIVFDRSLTLSSVSVASLWFSPAGCDELSLHEGAPPPGARSLALSPLARRC